MKKTIICILTFIIVCISGISAAATGIWGSVSVFDGFGNRLYGEDLKISIGFLGEIEYQLSSYNNLKLWQELDEGTKSLILSNAGEKEYFTIFKLKYGNIDDVEETGVFTVRLNSIINYGGKSRSELIGSDYRVYHLNDDSLEEIEIKYSDKDSVRFESDEIGVYILYYNPNIYDVKFYDEYPEDSMEAFYVIENLGKSDVVEFPEIPTKDGYVFTGWKQENMQGRYPTYFYIDPNYLTSFYLWNAYASWCPEDEYTPLEVSIDSKKKITKGKEDGCEIILTLSEGMFDETIDENVENDWKIVGNDELSISNVERIDNTTAKLTLVGNSSDKFTKGEIKVEFNSELYISHEGFGDNWDIHEIADIQLDENGIKRKMFISDNAVTLQKQKRGGSGGGVEKHTVAFETNGGEEMQSMRVTNGHTLEAPERVLKEGFVFAGWYTDEELTEKYDFTSPVTKGFTLYAAWEKPIAKQNLKQIFFPIKIIEEAIEFVKSVIR